MNAEGIGLLVIGSPLNERALNSKAKSVKAKLDEALQLFDGPHPEYFVKQSKEFKEEDDPLN
jgi:hypothetical protein